ncbi:MAG TPA: hypothetical protein VJB10_03660 [Candidatus Peribacteraceae bacterium]|nr:hypothetical protein [Candidatus Peribacteraceae bacterium]
MQMTCKVCGTKYSLSEGETKNYAKFGYDPPSLCFVCAQKQRVCFRNGRTLYRRKCDSSGETIVSMYAPDSPYTIYKQDIWWSDQWDPLTYGKEYDFNRPFFEQFKELSLQSPHSALTNINPDNSEYCNMCEGNRNCYLTIGGDFNEDCLYGNFNMHNRDVVDCDTSNDNEACFFILNSFDCYGCRFTFDSKNCSDCSFVSDCIGCSDCILCTNQRNKSFCILNEQLTKEEFAQRKSDLMNGTHSMQQKNWEEFLKLLSKRAVKATHNVSCEDCAGDYIKGSKNCVNCFDASDCEDCMNMIFLSKTKDSFNSGFIGDTSELCYNMQAAIAYDSAHSFTVFESKFIEYSEHIFHSEYMFGCSNVKKKKYCILNTQYSEEEYKDLRVKITEHMKSTGEWGQYFPRSFSCFGYNESTASEIFPMSKEEAMGQGFNWRDEEDIKLDVEKVIPASDLPDSIEDIPDDILNWAIRCEKTNKPFKLINQELKFYRTHRIPVPHIHPDERYRIRLSLKNPSVLWDRTCAKCEKAVRTSYQPSRPEVVYCGQCYLETVY